MKGADGGMIYEGALDSVDVPEPWKARGESLKEDLLRRMGGPPTAIE